jgi:hypothetical protein
MTTEELIKQTVDYTIVKLKLSGLMKDNSQNAFQKTEQVLRNYEELKRSHSEDGTANKFVNIINDALKSIENDDYYDIIPMIYFEGQSREDIAEFFDVTVTTISRNKRD